jgi:hypothetical protein
MLEALIIAVKPRCAEAATFRDDIKRKRTLVAVAVDATTIILSLWVGT